MYGKAIDKYPKTTDGHINFSKLKDDLDTKNMFNAISSFGEQIKDSFTIVGDCYSQNSNDFKNISKKINSILICGMGGSAIGGDIARVILSENTKVPIIINRSDSIPNWVNEQTLVVVSSYSGDTYETISAYNQARLKTNKIIAISSNSGLLSKYCLEHNYIQSNVPSGFQPRCALGYISSMIILLLVRLNLVDDISYKLSSTAAMLASKKRVGHWAHDINDINNPAIQLAWKMKDKIPVIYGSENYSSIIALRFKNQLQENSKVMAFSNNYPEINHNEIEGWNANSNNYVILWLFDNLSSKDKSIDSASKLLDKLQIKQFSISLDDIYPENPPSGKGTVSKTERLYLSIYFFDWVSYYLALLNKVNPSTIDNIRYIKKK